MRTDSISLQHIALTELSTSTEILHVSPSCRFGYGKTTPVRGRSRVGLWEDINCIFLCEKFLNTIVYYSSHCHLGGPWPPGPTPDPNKNSLSNNWYFKICFDIINNNLLVYYFSSLLGYPSSAIFRVLVGFLYLIIKPLSLGKIPRPKLKYSRTRITWISFIWILVYCRQNY